MISITHFVTGALLLPSTLAADWSGWGGGILNNRWAHGNTLVSSISIPSLYHHCTVSYPIGVSATPVIADDIAYFPTWDGTLTALNYRTCRMIWQISISDLIARFAPISPLQADLIGAMSRTSPQISGDVLFFGTQIHALVVALNRTNAQTLDIFQLDSHPLAIITQSPTFFDGKLFIGTSSYEHFAALDAAYPCCSFTGTFAALEFSPETNTFSLAWNISTIPPARKAQGWAGGSVWGSQPSINTVRRHVYIGTGNSYTAPEEVIACQKENSLLPFVSNDPDPCLPSDVWQDSILAIDIDSGEVQWVYQPPGVDAYLASCGYPGLAAVDSALCPQVPGPDADFGMAPTFIPERDALVAGRKNGYVYSLHAENGTLLWSTRAGPGGIGGGLAWGIAVDEERVFFAVINTGNLQWRLTPSNATISNSAYGALNLSNGKIIWQIPVPREGVCQAPPMTVGDLVLVARTGQDETGNGRFDASKGGLVALNKFTGRVEVDYELTSNAHSGVAVAGEHVLLGTGYNGGSSVGDVNGGFHVLKVEGVF